jgi:hypothetical protein
MNKLVNGELVALTPEEIASFEAEETETIALDVATQYKRDRQAAYPPIGDQLDALWKGGEDRDAMKAIIDAVKATYPKP